MFSVRWAVICRLGALAWNGGVAGLDEIKRWVLSFGPEAAALECHWEVLIQWQRVKKGVFSACTLGFKLFLFALTSIVPTPCLLAEPFLIAPSGLAAELFDFGFDFNHLPLAIYTLRYSWT